MDLNRIVQRMIRAAMLDPELYEEVEADTRATGEAALVVVLVSLLTGLGALAGGPGRLLWAIVAALAGWVVFALLTYYIGTAIFPGVAKPGEVLRTLGYAYTPGVLGVLSIVGVIPCLGPMIATLVAIVVWLWQIAATVIALRAALDLNITYAAVTAVIGWIIWLGINVLVRVLF